VDETQPVKKLLPYGTWPSPISAALVSQRLRIDDVQWAADGETLLWTEGRSMATVLVAQTVGQARRDLSDSQNLRGGVGYGGGAFSVSRQNNMVIFANRDGRLYRRTLEPGKPFPITPAFNAPASGVAAPAISPDGRWVMYIYSDGNTDLIGLADSSGKEWPVILTQGADFYMQPIWHPHGKQIAWVEWDHPNMPWDGTRVMVADFQDSTPHIGEVREVGGGESTPAQQPSFSPDGRWMSFIEEKGEWADLLLLDLTTGERNVLVTGEGFDLSLPAWVQGIHTTAWSSDSSRLYHLRYANQNASLWAVAVPAGHAYQVDTGEYTAISQLTASPNGDQLAFIAAAPRLPHKIVRLEKERFVTVAETVAATYDPEALPPSRVIAWDTSDGEQAYGIYYPPTHPSIEGSGAPPVILHIHGGPTSFAANSFNPEAAYFTSRGYGWVEVNYRGSTGYGRQYRVSMRQRWGDVDVEDTASCARALADLGLANPKQIVIMGGSAGGYTVLNALIRYPGLFKAGVCLYGVTNLFSLDMDTHKFEAHYNASMVGKLPAAAERYHAWSPVFHAADIRDALYIFQGGEDKVVPPSQAEEIITRLEANGVPYRYKLYPEEGHGFRSAETITDYLQETERFLQQHVLFAA
jgi:dipeptidyl aminopeptidase/acylaminoacyl peptidase